MNKIQLLSLWLTLFIATIVPTSLFAQSSYSCNCAADTLDCSDFASPSDAQACFWYCGSQGVGDIHQLDLDMNAIACDVVTIQEAAPPVPTPIPVIPTIEVVYPEPTPVPTGAYAYEVCSCGGDYYDCSTFSGPSHAQGCYDYCATKGFGDIHMMDPDGDGLACLVSGGPSVTSSITFIPTATPSPYVPPTAAPVYVAPTPIPTATPIPYVPPTAAPVYVAPTPIPTATPIPYVPPTAAPVYIAPTVAPTLYIPPTAMPMAIAPTSTPLPYIPGVDVNGKVVNPEACVCDYDYYNCSSFGSREDAVACATHCSDLGYGDIHRLDQGGAKDVICEAEFDAFIGFDNFNIPDAICDCSRDAYNCSDGSFQTQVEAQGCFNYCYYDLNVGDIHGLDGNDKDLMACESLPGPE